MLVYDSFIESNTGNTMNAYRPAPAFSATILLIVALSTAGPAAANRTRSTPHDVFTPVVVSRMGPPPVAFPGTDGRDHVVYELELTNTKHAPATLKRIDVLNADHPGHVLASYAGKSLLDGLRTLQPRPAESAVLPADSSRLFYVELSFKPGEVPPAITHRLSLLGAASPAPSTPATPLAYTVARIDLDRAPLPVVGPPLSGPNWLAVNGCCNSLLVHRGSFHSINGRLYAAQRFAIDYMRLDDKGRLVHGDPHKVRDYVGYGAKVLAVADGTVVSALDTLDDQPPGTLPNPSDITLETVDGNHVILDIGHGRYAFYAHLKKGSVTVHVGEHVKRGMVIGRLGNSGNTSAPHLHFHIMAGPSALGSAGLPYVIDHFDLSGQVDIEQFEESSGLAGSWGHKLAKPAPQTDRFPMDLNIVDFPLHR